MFVLTQICPFPPCLCSIFQQSTSANRHERAPHDAFPFPGHKHTRNAEGIGSVCAVKSQFVQKWVQVSSHTFGRTSNDLALQDNRGTSAEGCLVQNYVNPDRNYVGFESCPDMLCFQVILVRIKCTLWTISYIFFTFWQNRKLFSANARQLRANNAH